MASSRTAPVGDFYGSEGTDHLEGGTGRGGRGRGSRGREAAPIAAVDGRSTNPLAAFGVSNRDYAMSIGVVMGEAMNEGLVGMGVVAASALNRGERPGRFASRSASLGDVFAAPHTVEDMLAGRRTPGAQGARQYSTTYNSNIPGASKAAFQNFAAGARAAVASIINPDVAPQLGIRQAGFERAQKALEVAVKAREFGIDLGYGVTNYGNPDYSGKAGAGRNVATIGRHQAAPAGGYPRGVTPPTEQDFASRFAAAAALTGVDIPDEMVPDITRYVGREQIMAVAPVMQRQAIDHFAAQGIEAFPGLNYSDTVRPTGLRAMDVPDMTRELGIVPMGAQGFADEFGITPGDYAFDGMGAVPSIEAAPLAPAPDFALPDLYGRQDLGADLHGPESLSPVGGPEPLLPSYSEDFNLGADQFNDIWSAGPAIDPYGFSGMQTAAPADFEGRYGWGVSTSAPSQAAIPDIESLSAVGPEPFTGTGFGDITADLHLPQDAPGAYRYEGLRELTPVTWDRMDLTPSGEAEVFDRIGMGGYSPPAPRSSAIATGNSFFPDMSDAVLGHLAVDTSNYTPDWEGQAKGLEHEIRSSAPLVGSIGGNLSGAINHDRLFEQIPSSAPWEAGMGSWDLSPGAYEAATRGGNKAGERVSSKWAGDRHFPSSGEVAGYSHAGSAPVSQAEQKEYEKARAEYNRAMDKYEKDKAAYDRATRNFSASGPKANAAPEKVLPGVGTAINPVEAFSLNPSWSSIPISAPVRQASAPPRLSAPEKPIMPKAPTSPVERPRVRAQAPALPPLPRPIEIAPRRLSPSFGYGSMSAYAEPLSYLNANAANTQGAGGFYSMGGQFVDTRAPGGSWNYGGGYGWNSPTGDYYAAGGDFLPDGTANYGDPRSGNYSPSLSPGGTENPFGSWGEALGWGGSTGGLSPADGWDDDYGDRYR